MNFFRRIQLALCILLLAQSSFLALPHAVYAAGPTVFGVSPNQAYNYQPTPITISGSNFVATPTVKLGNLSLTDATFVDSTTLTATVPADWPAGSYTLTVTNPDSQSGSLPSAFTVLISGDGKLGTWQSGSAFSTGRYLFASVQANGYAYALGGITQSGDNFPSLTSVERAQIQSDGTLGLWQATTSLGTARSTPAAVSAGGYLYILGGADSSYTPLNSVERAAVNPDGSLGLWESLSAMTMNRAGLAAVVANGFVYALGGYENSTSGNPQNTVERAKINADGTLGSWQATSSMNGKRERFAALAANGYLYVFGGDDLRYYTSGIERASLQSDGSLGDWQVIGSLTSARADLGIVSKRGFVHAIGGYNGTPFTLVESAPIYSDGSLGTWQTINPLNTGRMGLGVIAADLNVYVLGGTDGTSVLTGSERVSIGPPLLTALSPEAVRSDQSTAVALQGTNFLPGASLRVGSSSSIPVTQSSLTTATVFFPSGFTNGWYTATLTNGDGQTATLANAIRVDGDGVTLVGDYGISINEGALFTNQVTVTLSISSKSYTAQVQLSNDGGFSGSPWETYASHRSWQITQYGSYAIPRVVYARYRDLIGNVSTAIQDDIILDVTAPTGAVQIISGASSAGITPVAKPATAVPANLDRNSASNYSLFMPLISNLLACNPTGTPNVTLKLSATDDVSGVGSMMISNRSDFNCASWETYATSKAWYVGAGTTTVYVKFRDNAGNVSAAVTATTTR